MNDIDNMLSVLESYMLDNPDDVAKGIADYFRKRRIEKNITREEVAEKSGVAVSTKMKSYSERQIKASMRANSKYEWSLIIAFHFHNINIWQLSYVFSLN